MNKLALAAAAALTFATFGTAAIAQDASSNDTGDFDHADANTDGFVSWEEALGVFPTLSQTIFDQADADGDGNLDESEFTALQGLTAGLDDDGAGSDDSSDDASSEASSSAM
jgi:hypothetical protein